MTFLPIVERELRTRARRGFTYWLRFYVGALGIFICLVQFFFTSALSAGGSALGGYAFKALITAAFMFCCGACLMTATAISAERSEGTLPLLFLTQVKCNDVLLGKLLPALLAGLCAVGAFLPVLMIPVLSGGVTGSEAFRSTLALAHTLFLSLVLGLRASACATSWFGSVWRAILLMSGWLFLPFVAGGCSMIVRVPWEILSSASPLFVIVLASETRYNLSPANFWVGLGTLQIVGWLLLLSTGKRLRKSLSEPSVIDLAVAPLVAAPPLIAPPPITTRSPTELELNLVVPPVAMLSPGPGRPLLGDGDPLQWLVRRQSGVKGMVWFGAIIATLNGCFFHTLYYWGAFGIASFFTWPASLAFDLLETSLFAWAITRFFIQARQTGELELIGTTPQGARRLVTTQRLAMKELFRGPVVLMMLPLGLRLLSWLVLESLGRSPEWRLLMVGHTLWSGVNLYLGITTAIWVGTWAGLTAPSQGRAVASTVWCITALPPIITWSVSIVLRIFRSGGFPDIFLFFVPSLTVTALYLLLIRRAKHKLAGELRDAAGASGSLFGSLSGLPANAVAAFRGARQWTPSG